MWLNVVVNITHSSHKMLMNIHLTSVCVCVRSCVRMCVFCDILHTSTFEIKDFTPPCLCRGTVLSRLSPRQPCVPPVVLFCWFVCCCTSVGHVVDLKSTFHDAAHWSSILFF